MGGASTAAASGERAEAGTAVPPSPPRLSPSCVASRSGGVGKRQPCVVTSIASLPSDRTHGGLVSSGAERTDACNGRSKRGCDRTSSAKSESDRFDRNGTQQIDGIDGKLGKVVHALRLRFPSAPSSKFGRRGRGT